MRALMLGAGNMGRAIRGALELRGDMVVASLGRERAAADAALLAPVDAAFEFSHADALLANARLAAEAGARVLVIGTTGWAHERGVNTELTDLAHDAGMQVVVGSTFSVGVVLFTAVAEEAARLFGRFPDYDPYVLEWHRRTKPDRPSGTAMAIADRLLPHLAHKRRARLAEGQGAPDPATLEMVSLRAGASPGMHLVGFDAPGESIELRVTARDRSAYVAGALLAADSLLGRADGRPGVTTFHQLLTDLTTTDVNTTGAER